MTSNEPRNSHSASKLTRRQFVKSGALGAAGLMAATAPSRAAHAAAKTSRPNFLLIVTDQQNLDALSAHGNPYVHTPNLDRLARRGVYFLESHSTNPVCSPARSSVFTGRMPCETGVWTNDRPIHDSVPDMGQWLRRAGYETLYCGKWHLPAGYPVTLKGFDVIPVGIGQGDLVDSMVARLLEGYLHNRDRANPFLAVASLMQPHDICYWAIKNKAIVPEQLRFAHIADQLPDLPPNHTARPRAPKNLICGYNGFNEDQWRYYLYVYYRQVEMVDADIGRILDALEDSGQADNTLVIFTADHGEGAGRHMNVQKWYPYDEAVKVPLIVAGPGRVRANVQDADHLVSGLDVMSTVCDYAGIDAPEHCRGRSLRPLLEGNATEWREFVAAETHVIGRVIRTAQYKYVKYKDDPVEQLFDMKADPWETKNRYDEPGLADVLRDHRRLLAQWEASLSPIPPTPSPVPMPPWMQRLLDIQFGTA